MIVSMVYISIVDITGVSDGITFTFSASGMGAATNGTLYSVLFHSLIFFIYNLQVPICFPLLEVALVV